eukprot:gnl/Chilomastix_caulleri/1145.p2 GENE.gnl/Chilomastix_caulleri/1145~~gnl/Chilomastix_caulleri/1145.p2  ORF type:complete len:83 (+),score=25.88 gnl/Chilomastix_caulleri/1145:257-505(+)
MGLVFETSVAACFRFLQRARRVRCEYTRRCTGEFAEATRKLLLEQPIDGDMITMMNTNAPMGDSDIEMADSNCMKMNGTETE